MGIFGDCSEFISMGHNDSGKVLIRLAVFGGSAI